MTLPNLAVSADLTARGIIPTAVHTTMLAVASSVVREAAGGPVLAATSTVTLWASDASQWLPLPGSPVTAVSAAVRDGVTLDATAYKLVDGKLWGRTPWGNGCEPISSVVTLTAGYTTVPPWVVNLVCDLTILGAAAAADGAHDPRVIAEKIDDYAVTFAPGAEGIATAMELPAQTRRALRARFGGGAAVVSHR